MRWEAAEKPLQPACQPWPWIPRGSALRFRFGVWHPKNRFRPGYDCVWPLYVEVSRNLETVGPLEPANAEAEERKTNEFPAAGSKYLAVHFAGMACRFLVICD